MLPRWLQAFGHLEKLPEMWRCVRRIENWRTLMACFFDLPCAPYPAVIRSRSGLQVKLEEFCDALTVWEMFCRDQYHVPPDAKTIIDLGANIGMFTLWAAQHAPAASFFCLEPFPKTFDRLVANVRFHGLESRVTCLQMALAADDTPRLMSNQPMGSSGRSLLAPQNAIADSGIAVPTITFPRLIQRVLEATGASRIDLVKMDIEGAEHEVLVELGPVALAPVGLIEFEYHPVGPRRRLFQALERAGLYCTHDARAAEDLGVAHFSRRSPPITNDK